MKEALLEFIMNGMVTLHFSFNFCKALISVRIICLVHFQQFYQFCFLYLWSCYYAIVSYFQLITKYAFCSHFALFYLMLCSCYCYQFCRCDIAKHFSHSLFRSEILFMHNGFFCTYIPLVEKQMSTILIFVFHKLKIDRDRSFDQMYLYFLIFLGKKELWEPIFIWTLLHISASSFILFLSLCEILHHHMKNYAIFCVIIYFNCCLFY